MNRKHVAGEVRGRPPQYFVLLLQLLGPVAQLAVLGLQVEAGARGGRRGGLGGEAVLAVDIFSQRSTQDSETPKLRATCAIDWSPCRATAIMSRRNSLENGLGPMLILPAEPQPYRQEINQSGDSPSRPRRSRLIRCLSRTYGRAPE